MLCLIYRIDFKSTYVHMLMIKYNKLHCIEILLNCGCSQVSSVLTDWPQVAWPSTQNRQCDQTGRNFAFWVFILKIHDVKYVKRYVCINVDKNGWATFWAIFPQNPLVQPRTHVQSRVDRFFLVQNTKAGEKCTKILQNYLRPVKYTQRS
jgi:hypothetical protein